MQKYGNVIILLLIPILPVVNFIPCLISEYFSLLINCPNDFDLLLFAFTSIGISSFALRIKKSSSKEEFSFL